jgi:hypothetical protein
VSSLAPTRPTSTLALLLGRLQLGRHKGLILAGLMLAGLAPPIYLLQTGGALSTGYTIQQLQRERSAWIVKNEQLGAEIARARSLAWIEAEAVHRLGMQRPTQQTVIRVDVPPPSFTTARPAEGTRARPEPRPAGPVAPTVVHAAGPTPSWAESAGAMLATLLHSLSTGR